MIEVVREGKYGELEEVMSEGLKGKVRAEGWEPKAGLAYVARRDREERATYFLRDVPKFEGSYAEAEIGRVTGEREKGWLSRSFAKRESGGWGRPTRMGELGRRMIFNF